MKKEICEYIFEPSWRDLLGDINNIIFKLEGLKVRHPQYHRFEVVEESDYGMDDCLLHSCKKAIPL